jgi:hypothetical protein
MADDQSSGTNADPARVNELADEARGLTASGASDDRIASWLKTETGPLLDSCKVFATARALSTAEAYAALHDTPTWKAGTKTYAVVMPDGAVVDFRSTGGRTFAVGDPLNLPSTPDPPHVPAAGRGTVSPSRTTIRRSISG